jgi:hypothetical protein
MRMIKIGEFIHIIPYSCNKVTICGSKVLENTTIFEKTSVWEATCPKCKRIISPVLHSKKFV